MANFPDWFTLPQKIAWLKRQRQYHEEIRQPGVTGSPEDFMHRRNIEIMRRADAIRRASLRNVNRLPGGQNELIRQTLIGERETEQERLNRMARENYALRRESILEIRRQARQAKLLATDQVQPSFDDRSLTVRERYRLLGGTGGQDMSVNLGPSQRTIARRARIAASNKIAAIERARTIRYPYLLPRDPNLRFRGSYAGNIYVPTIGLSEALANPEATYRQIEDTGVNYLRRYGAAGIIESGDTLDRQEALRRRAMRLYRSSSYRRGEGATAASFLTSPTLMPTRQSEVLRIRLQLGLLPTENIVQAQAERATMQNRLNALARTIRSSELPDPFARGTVQALMPGEVRVGSLSQEAARAQAVVDRFRSVIRAPGQTARATIALSRTALNETNRQVFRASLNVNHLLNRVNDPRIMVAADFISRTPLGSARFLSQQELEAERLANRQQATYHPNPLVRLGSTVNQALYYDLASGLYQFINVANAQPARPDLLPGVVPFGSQGPVNMPRVIVPIPRNELPASLGGPTRQEIAREAEAMRNLARLRQEALVESLFRTHDLYPAQVQEAMETITNAYRTVPLPVFRSQGSMIEYYRDILAR